MTQGVDSERVFEDAVVAGMLTQGWVLALGNSYKHAFGVDIFELAAFLRATQDEAWLRLRAAYGEDEETSILRFAALVAKQIDLRGTLDVLRHGVKDRHVTFRLAYFRPAHTLAAGALDPYNANRLTVVRQFRHSVNRPQDSVDLALFLNGLPVATAELKNPRASRDSETGTVAEAIRQYRARDPKELIFARRSLVHFAIDPDEVFLTTRLAGSATRFLPFNTGSAGPGQSGGSGNPSSSSSGDYASSYLWDQVWQRDNWLELIQNYLHVEDEQAKAGKAPSYRPGAAHTQPLIFPRFHQWHAVKELTAHAARHGAGENYLVQHSAGSGKSNTIAWLAHHLSALHTSENPADLDPLAVAERGLGTNQPVFNKVVVITDRRVLDKQLQDTIYQFEHTPGVVVRIDEDSTQLAEALTGETAKVVITTLQKFPFVLDKVADLSSRRYAVIIDEAHSSQGGKGAEALKKTLGKEGTPADDDDPATAEARARGRQANLSFFAFTATPKAKTLAFFGHRDPATGNDVPFHVYSMRQAIQEGFILDVLGTYVTYGTYFKLHEAAVDEAEKQVDPRKAKAKLVRAAILSEASMDSRAQVIVDHFRAHTSPRLGGRAKAMVVTSSREHAVLLYQAIRAYVERRGFRDCSALVAFSGALKINEIEYTEPKLNGISERELPERFGYVRADDPKPPSVPKDEYRILVVADKYQTGFDQPLLTTMYVDKPLAGIAAVQTLSRLNRTHPRKSQEDLFVLDFVNKTEVIQEAFQDYYETSINEPTDPNLLFDKMDEVMAYRLLVESEMQAFIEAYFAAEQRAASENALAKAHAKLYHHTAPAVDRFNGLLDQEPEKAEEFRRALNAYVNAYGWLSHVIGFESSELERLFQYGRFLLKRLPRRPGQGVDIGEAAPSHMRVVKTGEHELRLQAEGPQLVQGLIPHAAAGNAAEPDEKSLAEVIQAVNEEYGADLSTTDQILLGQMIVAVTENTEMQQVALNNGPEVFGRELAKELDQIVIDQAASNDALLVRYFDDENVNRMFKTVAAQQSYNLIRRPVRREAERRATQARAAELKSGARPVVPPSE